MSNELRTNKGMNLPTTTFINTKPAITVDYEKYQALLDNQDLSANQQQEILQTVWDLVCEFVSLGFNVHPLDETPPKCGKIQKEIEGVTTQPQSELYCEDNNLARNKNTATKSSPDMEQKGVAR